MQLSLISLALTRIYGGGVAIPFDPNDFWEPADIGSHYIVSDTSLLFQDSKGLLPVTTDGDKVGLIIGARLNDGAEIITNNTFDSATGWTVGAGWLITGGQAVATATSATLRWVTTLVDSRRYVVEFDAVVTSGTLNVNCGAAANTAITTSGHYKLHLLCGGAPTGGLYFNTATFTGTLDNVSLKEEDAFTLYQSTDANRPTYKAAVGAAAAYIDAPGGTSMRSSRGVNFSLPGYMAIALSRNVESGPLVIAGFGAGSGIQWVTTNGTYGLGATLVKAGVYSNVNAPAGVCSANIPVVVDTLGIVGSTTSWINGGSRYIDDHNSGNSGGIVDRANAWTGAESYANSYFGINCDGAGNATTSQCRFYGGFVMLRDPGSSRAGIHGWLMEQAGIKSLASQSYDLFVTAGQSNAMGVGAIASSPAVPMGDAVQFMARGGVHPLADPVQAEGVSSALYGSAWPAFANKYKELTGRKVAIVGAASSGEGLVFTATPLGGWSGAELVPHLAAKLAAAKTKIPGATVRGVLWAGGEQDALSAITVSSYKAALVTFRDALRTATGIPTLPLLILSIDNKNDAESQYAIMRQAQSEAASENEGIELVMSYQGFIDAGKSADGIHWNQTALNEAGVLAATSCAALF